MSKQDNSGPAFPRDHASDGHNGMTLRDYFAAKALAGMLSDHTTDCDYRVGETYEEFATAVAESAYIFADAMLKARTE